jgi:hypothetical protein
MAEVDRIATKFNAWIATRQLLCDFAAVISGAIVDDQDAEINVVLCENAFDAIAKVTTVIIAWNNNIYLRHFDSSRLDTLARIGNYVSSIP